MQKLRIRFDRQNRVVGHHGTIGIDAAELTLAYINARRGIKQPSDKNKAANIRAMAALRGNNL